LLARGDGLVAMRVEVADRLSTPRPPPPVKKRKGTLETVIIEAESLAPVPRSPIALVQLTGLAVHARIGDGDGSVVVTNIDDARPVREATVRYTAPGGGVIAEARTDSAGVATLHYARLADDRKPFAGMSELRYYLVDAAVAGDRATLPVVRGRSYYWMSNPLDPWSLGGRREGSPGFTATIFAERGIYRPGEPVYLKGVLRTGVLGALTVPSQQPIRLTVTYRPSGWESDEDVIVRDTVIRSSSFGTITDSLRLRSGAGLGIYVAEMMTGGPEKWTSVASEELRVAEYRAPEFLVTASSDSAPHFVGDTVRVAVAARYLFGAPMGRTPVLWEAELHELNPWEIRIPGAEGWIVGEWDWSRGGDNPPSPNVQGTDTLDDNGHAELRVALASLHPSRPGRVDVNVAVTDLNQQAVTSTARFPIHPAHLYILAKKAERAWYWTAGQPVKLQLRTVSPEGKAISGSVITASVIWRQWRWRNGASTWQDSTVRVDTVRAGTAPPTYGFTPANEGFYEVRLTASDGRGGVARTTVGGYAIQDGRSRGGPPFHLPLVASAREASPGDEVQVAFDSPFDSAQGWVTIERERVLEQHRLTIRRGMNTIPIRITAAHVPNVFVSVMLLAIRPSRDAHPDSTTQLLRAGYVEIGVGSGAKRLKVAVTPRSMEYAPRDSAVVRVTVSDSAHRGVRSEVTLWAVDDGVLALTGYTTPDLVDRLYQPRGLGAALWSTLPTVGIALPPLGALAWPGSVSLRGQSSGMQLSEVVVTQAGAAAAPAMRTQFRSTAFYLGSAVTGDNGTAELKAQLPDNLTTYRVMAVAVGNDDRFGSGDTTLLV
ncbi:MAG TPA: MG2 domain-containing protein, partial [Gemmatimonadaceae bacterium]|nr:MG2 domain-containing protein [Gemmatimonadaceae bacterium]